MIITKKQLIQEGILQGVKDNWGKGLIAAGGLAAANAGVFGPRAQESVETGGTRLSQFMKDAGDWSKSAVDKMNAKYGVDVNNDGNKEMIDVSKTTEVADTKPEDNYVSSVYGDGPKEQSAYAGDAPEYNPYDLVGKVADSLGDD